MRMRVIGFLYQVRFITHRLCWLAHIHQTHDWKFDEERWGLAQFEPASLSSYQFLLSFSSAQSLKPCYVENSQIFCLFSKSNNTGLYEFTEVFTCLGI